jgi:hypothetical protein
MWGAWPGLSCDERRRFDEIARRIDQDEFPIPLTTTVIPVRLAALGLFVVSATGVVTGLARSDAIILAVVGFVPAAVAVLLIVLVRAPGRATAAPTGPLFWRWLTTCAEDGCRSHPTHLGWCSEHAPGYDPGPDEYWEDAESDQR